MGSGGARGGSAGGARGPHRRHRHVRRPPPEQGVRGIDAYRATWPPFFDWQRQGACFEIDTIEVTAGDRVAFAQALLRCADADTLRTDPDQRLRLTLGFRKEEGRWQVAHEHHSFTLRP